MIYVTMITSFFILLCLVIAGIQNASIVQIHFLVWTKEMPLSDAFLLAAVAGACIVAVLSIPKLSIKSFQARRLRKEVLRLEMLCKKAI